MSLFSGKSSVLWLVVLLSLIALLYRAYTIYGVKLPRQKAKQELTSVKATQQRSEETARLFKPLQAPSPAAENTPAETHEVIPSPTKTPTVVKQRGNNTQVDSRFRKVDFSGKTLDDNALSWSCARDLQTGLLWEVKRFDAGISDAEHSYSWFISDREYPGREDGGICFGLRCDTEAYTAEMNRLSLCGSHNWRLPDFIELESLIDRNYYNPTINQEIFPHAQGSVYWSSTELENNPEMVMQVDFFNGISRAVPKHLNYAVRLASP